MTHQQTVTMSIRKKLGAQEKAGKSINFDAIVLQRLEARCAREHTTISSFVNAIIRRAVMDEVDWYRELARFYHKKFSDAQYMVDQEELRRQLK